VNFEILAHNPFNIKENISHQRRIPGVSVIIPAYNCANTIIRTLQSVDQSITYCKNQFDKNLAAEVVIVVDNPSDATYDVARKYIDQRDGFQIIQNQSNYGAGPSRNIGVRHSQGDLIFFLDGDDIYFEEHIYLCVYHMVKYPHVHYARTAICIDEEMDPQWKTAIENSVPINICVRRWCHEIIGGYFEEDAFKVCRCEDALYRDLQRKFFSGLTIKKETVQHFRYPGNALDRQMQKFALPPDAGVDSLTEAESAIMPEIHKIYDTRADHIRIMLTHWMDFLKNSAAI
jgi:glycosyltransferase involved in cell wall biosynthesis